MPIGTPFPRRSIAPSRSTWCGTPVRLLRSSSPRSLPRARRADAIVVDYDPLPAVVDPELAMKGKPALVHEEFANNIALGARAQRDRREPDGKSVDDSTIDEAFKTPTSSSRSG